MARHLIASWLPVLRWNDRAYWAVVVGLLSLHAILLCFMAANDTPNEDEIGHLGAGISHLQTGGFRAFNVNPPLVRVVAVMPAYLCGVRVADMGMEPGPFSRPEFELGKQVVQEHADSYMGYLFAARCMVAPLSIVGALSACRWATKLYGRVGGLLTLFTWTFCPSMLAYGHLITPDMGAAALGCLACFLFYEWLTAPSWLGASLAGIGFGLALLAKSTWLILFAAWPAAWLVWQATTPTAITQRTGTALQLGMALAIGLLVVNAGYGFEGSGTPLSHFEFISASLGGGEGSQGQPATGNRFHGTWLAFLPVPMPVNFVRGVDRVKWEYEKKKVSYLRGERRMGGWWYYYLYAIGVKTPVGTLALFAISLATMFIYRPRPIRDELFLLAIPAIVVATVSSQTGFNHHLRYVLPAFPFLYIWIGRLGQFVAHRKPLGILVLAACVTAAAGSLRVFPHSLSYFNVLAGGPTNGHAHLAYSNIDWGQDLLYLKRWLDAHEETAEVHAKLSSFVEPSLFGLRTLPFPNTVSAGWYAIGVNQLCMDETLASFLKLRPVAMAGYSIYIYHLNETDAALVNAIATSDAENAP